MKTYQQLSVLTLTLAFVSGFVSISAHADDMMKPDTATVPSRNDTMTKSDSMMKDKMDTSKTVTKTGNHMDKKSDTMMKSEGVTKDMPDKMAPDTTMMNK